MIEPMPIMRIKELVTHYRDDLTISSLIMAWAHERARVLSLEWPKEKTDSEWLADTLDFIGWPKEQR